jgi:hypothetical protein
MIEIETETPNLQGFSAAFVLSRIDSGAEHVKDLVIAGKERALEDFGVASVDGRLNRGGCDHDALA